MTPSQWTVTGLIVLLVGLEVVRSPNVKGFFTGIIANFNGALNAANPTPAVATVTAPSSFPASGTSTQTSAPGHGKSPVGG